MKVPEQALAPPAFYDRPVLAVARDLLGATVRHGPVAVRLTEVEAYGGPDDPASHAFRGLTRRNAAMFGPPGRAYVYFVYGMHWCLNLVCGPPGQAGAVLLRAGEVHAGLVDARARSPRLGDRDLARGPGRLARALGVDGTVDGTDVTGGGPLGVLVRAASASTGRGTGIGIGMGSGTGGHVVLEGPRVGVRGGEDLPWRLWLAGEPSVSRVPTSRAPGRRSTGSQDSRDSKSRAPGQSSPDLGQGNARSSHSRRGC